MSKNVLLLGGIAVGALFFSSRPGQVSAEPQGLQRAALRHDVDLHFRRYELIGMGPDKVDQHTQGTSVFVLDHETGNVIKHSFGGGTQRGLVVVSNATNAAGQR